MGQLNVKTIIFSVDILTLLNALLECRTHQYVARRFDLFGSKTSILDVCIHVPAHVAIQWHVSEFVARLI
jgi:hypothetical protein